ncbi:DUF3332 family protein [Psychromonas sp. Urea-02u-13]|uniref:DUF3332 family protein n=1 Tax=Psychromonas sp. Urea-02u-13 TaxID=2058326 RepID=UPI000C32B32F|nr:DUF3332 family protein [Psychromonas sp. Urea-02u-13]PKG40419.1 hypothetical protein CXF74_03685 [Psychromonas sp. Urea-02u-13]
MKKILMKIGVMIALSASLAGCVGSNAVTTKLMQFNLEAVDNRYARGGLNILLAPVYALTVAVDALVFNAIGFWSGQNPLNGKPHIFDTKTKTMLNINDDLDPSLKEAPIDPITQIGAGDKSVYSAQAQAINADTLDFHIVYTNGEKAVLRGEKQGDMVTFYMDGEFVTTASITELEAYVAPKA